MGSQRDVVYLGWPIAPSYMSPNAEGWGVGAAGSQPMSTACTNKLWISDSVTPYLTYTIWYGDWHTFTLGNPSVNDAAYRYFFRFSLWALKQSEHLLFRVSLFPAKQKVHNTRKGLFEKWQDQGVVGGGLFTGTGSAPSPSYSSVMLHRLILSSPMLSGLRTVAGDSTTD